MKKQIVVASARELQYWCAERGVPRVGVIPLYSRGDEQRLARGFNPSGVQVTQLEPPEDRAVLKELDVWLRRGRPESKPGLFVVFEGGEGAGKSTQLKRLADVLWLAGRDVVITREPGGTRLGHTIRRVLLDTRYADRPAARTETLLFAADRAHHVESVIRPALARGAVVLSDRYVDSSMAYQAAGRDLDEEQVRALSAFATAGLVPDLTVLLDVPVEIGQQRVRDRGGANRLDAEQADFHRRVRRRFLDLAEAEPHRYLMVDAQQSEHRVGDHVGVAMEQLVDEPLPLALAHGAGGLREAARYEFR